MPVLKELTENCNRRIKNNRKNFVIWSFTNGFDDIHWLISKEFRESGFDNEGWKCFIKICDNRIKQSEIFLNEITCIAGFIFVALSLIATMINVKAKDPVLHFLTSNEYLLSKIVVIFAFVCLIILFLLLIHYRMQIHGWTAFKEQAILQQSEKMHG